MRCAASGGERGLAGSASAPRAPVVFVVERQPVLPPIAAAAPAAPVAPIAPGRVTAGIALPVPDARAPVETTIASADELRTALPGTGAGEAPLIVEQPAPVETLPAFRQHVCVEELPEPVHSVAPEYPALAREAGVSGLVVAHLLVGRDGRVLEVRLDERHSVLMLNEAALRAARQWVFKPALGNNRPVAVWVAVPFDFHLQ